MVSKKTFIEVMQNMQEIKEFEDSLNKICCTFNAKIDTPDITFPSLQDSLIKVLEEDLGCATDEYYGSDIDYFVYTLEFGKCYKPGMVTDENGDDIDISTIEKLYDYLTLTQNKDTD